MTNYKPEGTDSKNDWSIHVAEGWKPIIRGLQMMAQSREQDVVPQQIKEKFGSLRFYYTGGDEDFAAAVRAAEAISCYTCEKCGRPGSATSVRGWVKTVCPEHAEEMNA